MSATTKPAPKGGKNSTTETLVLTKDKRQALESRFVRSGKDKVLAIREMFPYVHYTVDQIIQAMYANADKNDDELVVDSGARTTMNRALVIAKAWILTKAVDLVPEDNQDAVLEALAQIADITPGVLAGYQIPKAKWEGTRPEYSPVTVRPTARTKPEDMFDPYEADIRFGCGDKADTVLAIVEAYLEERVEHDGVEALLWIQGYRNGVVYASNEYRRKRGEHNKRAADARKGDGDGSNKRAARNPGGKDKSKAKGKSKAEPADEPEARKGKGKAKKSGTEKPAPSKPKTPDEIASSLTIHDLIVVLTKRIADYGKPITVADAKAWDDMTGHYDRRFRKIPVGKTALEVTKRGTVKRDKNRAQAPASPQAPVKVVTARNVVALPVRDESAQVPSLSYRVNKALLAEQKLGRITAAKRKKWVTAAMEGRMTEAQFKARLAKIQPAPAAAAR